MADVAFGFRPLSYAGPTHLCVIPASDGTATFIGDAVKLHGSEDTTDNATTVIQAAAGNVIYGVIVGFVPDYSNLATKYRLASTRRLCMVVPALPSIEFEVQADAAVTAGDSGTYYDMVVGSGSTTSGRSAMEIGISTAGNTGQLQLLRPSRTVDETFDTTAAGTNVVVHINESVFKVYGGTAIAGNV